MCIPGASNRFRVRRQISTELISLGSSTVLATGLARRRIGTRLISLGSSTVLAQGCAA